MTDNTEKDLDYTDEAVCPYCFNEYEDTIYSVAFCSVEDGEDMSVTCESCEKDFIVTVHITHHYSTNPIKETL